MSSSFWQPNLNRKKSPNIRRSSNQSLPCLNSTLNIVKSKGPSKTVHQILLNDPSKNNIVKNQLIRPDKKHKKTTLISIQSRSMYRLPTAKNKIQEIPSLEFNTIITKVQEIFNQECNLNHESMDNKFKFKKTMTNKLTFGKLAEYQVLLETNPKKQTKRQFEEILRIYNKNLLKIPLIAQKQKNNKQLLEKSQKGVHFRKQATWSLNSSPIHYDKENNAQGLMHWEKQQFFKQTKAFQKAQKHLTLKTFTGKLFYHHLTSELALQLGKLDQALTNLYFCEYYARKIDFDLYIIPCLIIQFEIKQTLYEFDQAINILKTALQFSVIKRWKQLEMRILEKISMVYYYRGNSYMAKYYKEISESGLPQPQFDIYVKQYSKSEQLRSLEARLFSLPFDSIKKKKHNQKYQLDLSRDLLQDHQKLITSHHEEVSAMLRNNKTSKIGIKLRKMILDNSDKGSVKRVNNQKHTTQIVPKFVAFQYPLQHCSQIIKSHLSKDRYMVNSQIRNANFSKTLGFMRTLYSRICYELNNEKFLQGNQEKQNVPLVRI